MRVFQGLVTAYISSHKYKEALTAAKATLACRICAAFLPIFLQWGGA